MKFNVFGTCDRSFQNAQTLFGCMCVASGFYVCVAVCVDVVFFWINKGKDKEIFSNLWNTQIRINQDFLNLAFCLNTTAGASVRRQFWFVCFIQSLAFSAFAS